MLRTGEMDDAGEMNHPSFKEIETFLEDAASLVEEHVPLALDGDVQVA